MQPVFLVFLYIGFVADDKCSDLSILEIRPVLKLLYKHILSAAEFRLHAVAVYGEDAVRTSRFRRCVDIDSLAFIYKLCRIADTGSKPALIICQWQQLRTVFKRLHITECVDEIIDSTLMSGVKVLI